MTTPRVRKASRKQLIVLTAVLVPLAVIIAVVAGMAASHKPSPQDAATTACEGYVQAKTGGNPLFTDEKVSAASPGYTVDGVAHGSFGHKGWSCTVVPDGSNWTLVSLALAD